MDNRQKNIRATEDSEYARNMKDKMGLRKYIVTILDDIRGDNEFPTDEIIQANASLLLTRFENEMKEIIEEDEEEPVNVEHPYHEQMVYEVRLLNGLKSVQRERLKTALGGK